MSPVQLGWSSAEGQEMGGSEDHDSGKVTALPAFALESRRLQACPNVERSTQRPPAQGGERFLPGHFNGVLPPFGRVGEGVKKIGKLEGKNTNL